MKTLVLGTLMMLASALLADAAKPAPAKKQLSEKERAELRLRKSGGWLERPGSMKGLVAVIDTQSILTPSNLVMALNGLSADLKHYNIQIFCKAPGNPADLKKSVKADVALVVVANDNDPSLLVLPDDGLCVVNMKKVTASLTSKYDREHFLDSRCRKAFLRAFVAACGGLASSYPGNIMDVARVQDLDLHKEFIPFDKFLVMDRQLREMGLSPREVKTYRLAYMQGWAPAPTNDIQRGVIEDVKRIQAEKEARSKKK